MISLRRILLLAVLLIVVNGKWIYTHQQKCAIDSVGSRRFFTNDGYRLCNEKNCPPEDISPFEESNTCCHACCYNFLKTSSSENVKNTIVLASKSNIENVISKISYVLNVVLVAIIIALAVLYYKKSECKKTVIIHQNSLTDRNCLLPTTVSTSNDEKISSIVDMSATNSSQMQTTPQMKTLITADSSKTLSGKRFEVAFVNELNVPPSYHFTPPI